MYAYTHHASDASYGRYSVSIDTSDSEPLDGQPDPQEIAEQVPTWSVDADYQGEYASHQALELLELAHAKDQQPVPIYETGGAGLDGYYITTGADRDTSRQYTSRQGASESVSMDLSRKGSTDSHCLAVETDISQPEPGHPYGNDMDAIVGLPAAARRVRLVDATSEPSVRERPTPVATVEAEHGAIDLYDASSETVDNPVYLYDLAYDAIGDVDVGVWDTYGRDSIVDEDGVVAWARVFDTAHEFGEGALVLENGRLRVTIDEPTNTDETARLEAEAWDPSAASGDGAWTAIDLPSYADGSLETQWEPADVDLTRIAPARVAAQVEFEAVAGTAEGEVYAADVQLDRGHDRLFVTETSDGELPADLEALLEPIASTSVLDSGVEQGLVARSEVRA